ncbi:uncharacterized protein LOC131620058 [Vicia villosa]|uniref:uncharacterized protein LOC131620058 n=1 Tax=Vicia villosa TaxID=3911 RepID=UPI00273B2F2C|nr:uncharacterized protein LOC131620058 [Vicia villosa]
MHMCTPNDNVILIQWSENAKVSSSMKKKAIANEEEEKVTMDEILELKIHHSGQFIDCDLSVYEGGVVDTLKVDADKWSYFELVGVLKELGYRDFEKMYYNDPQFGMNALVDDTVVDVVVEHVDEVEDFLNKLHDEIADKLDKMNDANVVVEEGEVGLNGDNVVEGGEAGLNGGNVVVEEGDAEINGGNIVVEGGAELNGGNANVASNNVEVLSNNMGEVHDESDDDSEDESFQYDSALEVSFEDESDGYDEMDDDELADLIEYETDGKSSGKKKQIKDTGECKGSDNNSDDLQSGCDSDDNSGNNRKKDLKFMKNDKKRVRVRCKDGCQWDLYCAKLPDEDSWQVRKIIDEHNCSREFNVKLLSTKWLSKRIHNSLKNNPRLKGKDIKDKALRKWNMGINKTKAIRARVAAGDKVDGSFLGDYTRIYDYCHELLRANPGSTIKMNVEPVPEGVDDQRPYFKRAFVGGKILAAIGRDPNDQMLPIAYAVVESENKESWTWFLEFLIADLGGATECLTYTFILDQQKGLLPAMDELLPNVEQRFCVRHLYNNFRKRFPGKLLKEVIWKAAKSTYAQAWETEMKRMRLANQEAYLHMMNTPPRFCSRSYFRTTNKCDVVLNNMSESFNNVILDSRGKPLVIMLEESELTSWRDGLKTE